MELRFCREWRAAFHNGSKMDVAVVRVFSGGEMRGVDAEQAGELLTVESRGFR